MLRTWPLLPSVISCITPLASIAAMALPVCELLFLVTAVAVSSSIGPTVCANELLIVATPPISVIPTFISSSLDIGFTGEMMSVKVVVLVVLRAISIKLT